MTLRRDRPGYQYRRRADGSIAHYWNPKRATKLATSKLPLRGIADDATDSQIVELCQRWTDELVASLSEAVAPPDREDGTISALISAYERDEFSPYRSLKNSTRVRDYDPILRLIRTTVGERNIRELRGEDFRRWYVKWGSERNRSMT